ncbi:hypothetical protein [Providencia manganoxydans]|uniref:hypothetical protein n=1 Tax=Providencia manganoxydans TaxID=2923283 RepID=UPI0034DD57C4
MKRARTFTVEITNREPAPLPHPTVMNGLIYAYGCLRETGRNLNCEKLGKGWKSVQGKSGKGSVAV